MPRNFRLPQLARVTAALGAVAALAVGGLAAPAQALTKAEKQRGMRTSVYVEGDSLTVGAGPVIKRKLRSGVRSVGVDAEIGRFTATGMSRLARDSRAKRARIWVLALGTNDGPDPAALKRHVNRSLRLAGPKREVIWLTVVRPGGYGKVNRMLRATDKKAGRLHVVDWAKAVDRNPGLIGGDGVHGTSRGYEVRGSMIATTALQLARRG
ncbi:MAG: hypothetical protein U0R64_09715 [Candidatus Nanopelagicales bacterium]